MLADALSWTQIGVAGMALVITIILTLRAMLVDCR
jgi:hypothetical protein